MKPTAQDHSRYLLDAEGQFKLVVAVGAECVVGDQKLRWPVAWTYGRRTIDQSELALSKSDAARAAAVLEHTATFTMCLAAVQAIKDTVAAPREHSDTAVVAAFEVTRLVRNAYAHQPFAPLWCIDPNRRGRVFEVPGIIRLDTAGLDGNRVKWQEYGGPLALLDLSRWIRRHVLVANTEE